MCQIAVMQIRCSKQMTPLLDVASCSCYLSVFRTSPKSPSTSIGPAPVSQLQITEIRNVIMLRIFTRQYLATAYGCGPKGDGVQTLGLKDGAQADVFCWLSSSFGIITVQGLGLVGHWKLDVSLEMKHEDYFSFVIAC